MRTSAIVSARLLAGEAGRDQRDEERRGEDADEDDRATTSASSAPTAPATRSASRRSPRATSAAYTGMNDAESAPSPNRFCRKFGNAERGVERVGGFDAEAEVVREDAQPDQAGQPASAGCRPRRTDARCSLGAQTSSSRAGSPSVPLDFFIRYVLMKPSRSPSSTRLTSPTCSFVRWSFTI